MSKPRRASRKPAGAQPGARKAGAMTAAETPASVSITKGAFTTLLQRATIAYLSLPLVIFLVGYLHFGWAAAAAVSLFAGLWFYFRNSGELPRDNETIPLTSNITWSHIAICLPAALFFTSLFGAGGWGHQTLDWFKHNAMLSHLSMQPWPVLVNEQADGGGEPLLLVYYTGYYLPAALVGKVFGFTAANHALFLWTALGVFLSLLWVFAFARTSAKWIIVLFFFFSDPDVIGTFINKDCKACGFQFHLEWWSSRQLAGTMVGLAWLPQHVITAWLLTSLLLRDIAAGQGVRRGLLLITLGVLFSVMSAFGIAVLMVFYYLIGLKKPAGWNRPFTAPENWCALLPLACVGVYIAGSSQSGGAFALSSPASIAGPPFPMFIVLSFFLLWGVVFAASRRAAGHAAPFLGGLERVFMLSAVMVPLFYWFESYDLQKNASHPAVFILMLATIRLLEAAYVADAHRRLKNFAGVATFLLLIGAWTPIVEMNQSLHKIHKRGSWYQEIKLNTLHNDPNFVGHFHRFVGKLDSPFYRHFARNGVEHGN